MLLLTWILLIGCLALIVVLMGCAYFLMRCAVELINLWLALLASSRDLHAQLDKLTLQ